MSDLDYKEGRGDYYLAAGKREERERAHREAGERIRRMLETGRWPSGNRIHPRERELIIANARRDGHDLGDAA